MGLTWEELGYRRIRSTEKPFGSETRYQCGNVNAKRKSAPKQRKEEKWLFEHLASLDEKLKIDPDAKSICKYLVPIKLETPNLSLHWREKHRLNKKIKRIVTLMLKLDIKKCKLPCHVVLTRIGPRKLDFANLVYSFKHVQDVVADMLIPGLAPGQADSSEEIEWSYLQESRGKGMYAVQIEILQL